MPGDTNTDAVDAQALWDEMSKEHEAGTPPSDLTTSGTPEPAADSTSQQEETPPAQAPGGQSQPAEADPFATMSPELKARFEKLEQLQQQVAQIPALIQQVKTAEGRVAAMQREMDQAKAAAKAVQGGPSAEQIKAAAGNTEKWDSLKSDFPEWAEATEQYVKASLAGISQAQIAQLDPSEVDARIEQRLAAEREQTLKAIEEAKVEGKYPAWKQEINSPEFVDWYTKQPDEVRALGASKSGLDAIRVLDAWNATKGGASQVRENRQAKLTAAAATTRPGQSAAPAKTVENMTPAELWAHESKLRAKKNAGSGLIY